MESCEGRVLECPICCVPFDSGWVLPMVYSCGHGICIDCDEDSNNKMKHCHACRKPITSRAKNYLLIEILEMSANLCNRKAVDCNFLSRQQVIESKIGEFEESCKSLDEFFPQCGIVQIAVLKNYKICTKMAENEKCRARQSKILEKRAEFLKEAISIYKTAEFDMRSRITSPPTAYEKMKNYVCTLQNSLFPTKSKLQEFHETTKMFDETVANFQSQWDVVRKEYEKWPETTEKCECIDVQNEHFKQMEEYIDWKKTVNEDTQLQLEDHIDRFGEIVTEIRDWCAHPVSTMKKGKNRKFRRR